MALDRYITWKKKRPSRKDAISILANYLRGAYGKIEETEQLIGVQLLGPPTFPFRDIKGEGCIAHSIEIHKERWFAVDLTRDGMTITTRLADEYTQVVADGYGTLMARFYETKMKSDP